MQLVFERGTGHELVTAAAGNLDVLVIGMDVGFHFFLSYLRDRAGSQRTFSPERARKYNDCRAK